MFLYTRRAFLCLVVGFTIVGALSIPAFAHPYTSRSLPPPADAVVATVLRVIDGDTILISIDGLEERLRYIGIDTPETVHPTKGLQEFGREASAANRALVEGADVLIEFDVEPRDMYGRLLGYVYLPNDGMINAILLEIGYATLSTWPPNVTYVGLFRELQRQAVCAERGLWDAANAECESPPPDECGLDTVPINTASLERLRDLPGIGEILAQRIVDGRPYANATDLLRVTGIGDATAKRLEPSLCFAPGQ